MAHDSKQGFLSSLFGKKKKNENEEIEQLELRQKLEERIRQVLADRTDVPDFLAMEKQAAPVVAAPVAQEEEPEVAVNLLPISASVIGSRKEPVQANFLISSFEVPRRAYAANER